MNIKLRSFNVVWGSVLKGLTQMALCRLHCRGPVLGFPDSGLLREMGGLVGAPEGDEGTSVSF